MLCKDTDINHGAAGEEREKRKSIFDCLSEFQFGPVKTKRVWAQDIRGVQAGAGSAGGWLTAHSSGFMCGSAEIHLPFCLHEAPVQTLPLLWKPLHAGHKAPPKGSCKKQQRACGGICKLNISKVLHIYIYIQYFANESCFDEFKKMAASEPQQSSM